MKLVLEGWPADNAPVIWNPRTLPYSGLSGAFTFYASEGEWSPRFPGTKVGGAFPRPFFSTHGTPFVKQLIIAKRNTLVKKNTVGSHEINWLIFERPANNLVGDAKTGTSSEFPAYQGTKMKGIWGESPLNPPP